MADENNDEQFYRDTESIAFTKINDRQLTLLEPLGSDARCSAESLSSKQGNAISG
jgi:hypothetical protein